jgi:hypothetical protein
MTQLPFGAGRYLTINIGEPIVVQQGTGVNRLLLPLKLQGTGTMRSGIPMTVSGCAWLSMSSMDWLGTWTTERPLVMQTVEFDGQLFCRLVMTSSPRSSSAVPGARSESCSIQTW